MSARDDSPMMPRDPLWPGGPVYAPGRFPLCTDSLLLAHFAGEHRARHCIDLGCGAGLIALLLCTAQPRLTAVGLELDETQARLARENLAANGLSPRTEVLAGDIRDSRSLFPPGTFDLVVTNPPYFAPDSAGGADPSRTECCCTLEELCRAAAWLCAPKGRFALVHRPEALSRVLCAMTAAGLEPKRLQFIVPRAEKAPCLFLAEGRRDCRPGLAVQPPIILQTETGEDTLRLRRLYHYE